MIVRSCALLLLLTAGCYSFTGASIPSHIHSIAIPYVDDQSGFGQSELRQQLTDLLQEKFIREGSLQLAERPSADALLETVVTRVSDEPVGVRAGEALTNKRITIFVEAVYRDQKKQRDFWKRSFQQSADYAISENLDGLRRALREAEEKLAEDLLLGVISNW
jgi:hypothetical protein